MTSGISGVGSTWTCRVKANARLLLQERGSPPKTQNSLRAFSVLDSNDGQAASHIGAENLRQVLAPTSREGRWPRVSMLSLHSPHMREKAYPPSLSPRLLPLVVITHTHTHSSQLSWYNNHTPRTRPGLRPLGLHRWASG